MCQSLKPTKGGKQPCQVLDDNSSFKCAAGGCKVADKVWTRLDNFQKYIERMHKAADNKVLIKRWVPCVYSATRKKLTSSRSELKTREAPVTKASCWQEALGISRVIIPGRKNDELNGPLVWKEPLKVSFYVLSATGLCSVEGQILKSVL